jgi:hypothetical protein
MTFRLSRDSSLAMEGNRYPVTEIGFKTLSLRLVEVLQQELGRDEAEIKTYSNAKVNGQPCDFFRMTYLKRRADSPYHIVEVSFDKERQIPFYFRSFGWLAELDREAALLEEYFFNRIQTNVGLTDADFDARNPDYQFDEPQQDAATGFAETEHAAESDLDRMPE